MRAILLQRLKTASAWQVVGLSIVCSVLLTAMVNGLMSLAGLGRLSRELLVIGIVDAIIVPAIVAPLVFSLFKRVANLQELNQGLQNEIAERKRAEQSLLLLERALETMNVGVTISNPEGAIIYANPAEAHMHGYTVEELLGKPSRILAPPDLWRPSGIEEKTKAWQGWQRESINLRKDASTFPVQLLSDVVKDAKGELVGIVTSCLDITERKKAEEALVHRAQEMTALYETSLAINAQLDLTTLLRAILQRATGLLGTRMGGLYMAQPDGETLKLMVGHNLPESNIGTILRLGEGVSGRVAQTGEALMVPDHAVWEGRPAVYGDAPYRRVLGVPLKVGNRVIGVISITDDQQTGLFSQEEVRLASLFADQATVAIENARLYETAQRELSERKHAEEALRRAHDELELRVKERTAELARANQELREEIAGRTRIEAALRESEERYRSHFENVNEVIYSIDPEMRVLNVSPSVERHLGYKPEELIGRTIHELNLLAPNSVEAAFSDALRVLSGEHIDSAMYEFITKDGLTKQSEVSGAPLFQEGQIVALVSVARDITERNRADEQLRQSLREKEVLLKEIHHRVKNNLQVVSSLLNLQSSQVKEAASLEVLRESQNRVKSMALIHEELYQSPDLGWVDFGEYVRHLTLHLFHSYQVKPGRVALYVRVSEDIKLGIDTAIPCGLIVNELVSNAFKHGFAEGRSGEVRVELERDAGRQLTLTVSDNGTGFPAGVDFRNTESLGLQLVTTLVDQLGGAIELDQENRTSFKITFTEPPL